MIDPFGLEKRYRKDKIWLHPFSFADISALNNWIVTLCRI